MRKGRIEFRGDIHMQFSYFKAYRFEFQCGVWDDLLVEILFIENQVLYERITIAKRRIYPLA